MHELCCIGELQRLGRLKKRIACKLVQEEVTGFLKRACIETGKLQETLGDPKSIAKRTLERAQRRLRLAQGHANQRRLRSPVASQSSHEPKTPVVTRSHSVKLPMEVDSESRTRLVLPVTKSDEP